MFATYHKINYTKLTWKTYVRHRRQGRFIGFHFLIALLKEATESTFLTSTGTSSQILGARWDNVAEPKTIDFIDLEWNYLSFFLCYKMYSHWMERLLSSSLVKVHSLFYTNQLQELEYFAGALKQNYQFLKVLQKMM